MKKLIRSWENFSTKEFDMIMCIFLLIQSKQLMSISYISAFSFLLSDLNLGPLEKK